MKTLVAALVATFAFAGVASAKEPPQLIGNYSQDVLQEYNLSSDAPILRSRAAGDVTSTAAVHWKLPVQSDYGPDVSAADLHR